MAATNSATISVCDLGASSCSRYHDRGGWLGIMDSGSGMREVIKPDAGGGGEIQRIHVCSYRDARADVGHLFRCRREARPLGSDEQRCPLRPLARSKIERGSPGVSATTLNPAAFTVARPPGQLFSPCVRGAEHASHRRAYRFAIERIAAGLVVQQHSAPNAAAFRTALPTLSASVTASRTSRRLMLPMSSARG